MGWPHELGPAVASFSRYNAAPTRCIGLPPEVAIQETRTRTMKLIDIIGGVPIPFSYRMAFITNFYREPLLRRMEQEYGIIRPEWTVLICLSFRDGLNPRDICEITEQPRNTISRAVAALVGKGLVSRDEDLNDARRKLLHITDRGRQLYEAIMPMFVERERRMLEHLDDAERRQLGQILEKLCRAAPAWASDQPVSPSRTKR